MNQALRQGLPLYHATFRDQEKREVPSVVGNGPNYAGVLGDRAFMSNR